MTRVILLLIALVIALPALADVSDSGNLTIGGQGIIQGTMTIQGAGFSVGGTTFTVAGGSATLGDLLNADAAGIKWADGSVSTTAFAVGGGGSITISIGSVALSFAVAPANNFNVCYATFSMISTGRPSGSPSRVRPKLIAIHRRAGAMDF